MTTPNKPVPESVSGFFEQDHREIDAILAVVAFEFPEKAVEPFKEFDRRLERHIHWEEGILFPAVARKAPDLEAGPLRVMKLEHEEIRRHKAAALKALREGDGSLARDHVRAMTGVLKPHNVKEEHILYPACDDLLSGQEAREMFERIRAAQAPAA